MKVRLLLSNDENVLIKLDKKFFCLETNFTVVATISKKAVASKLIGRKSAINSLHSAYHYFYKTCKKKLPTKTSVQI